MWCRGEIPQDPRVFTPYILNLLWTSSNYDVEVSKAEIDVAHYPKKESWGGEYMTSIAKDI